MNTLKTHQTEINNALDNAGKKEGNATAPAGAASTAGPAAGAASTAAPGAKPNPFAAGNVSGTKPNPNCWSSRSWY